MSSLTDAPMSSQPRQSFFDDAAVRQILAQTGLPRAASMTDDDIKAGLNEIAGEYYWEAATPRGAGSKGQVFSFDEVADSWVTPSRLKNRLVQIERAAKWVSSGTSRRPSHEKVAQLLGRLGYSRRGTPLKYSGQEASGHGGSERSAVLLCLVRAINATERPPRGYRAPRGTRPWASLRLFRTIKDLSAAIQLPGPQHQAAAISAARSIEAWAQWCLPHIRQMHATNPARHQGHLALDLTLLKLARLYGEVFDEQPSLSRRVDSDGASIPNAWERFLQAALSYILEPENMPSLSALSARWRRLNYTDRKNRF